MNTGYLIYQAERTPSAAKQHEIDRSNAQLAASAARLWRAAEAGAGRAGAVLALTGLAALRERGRARPVATGLGLAGAGANRGGWPSGP